VRITPAIDARGGERKETFVALAIRSIRDHTPLAMMRTALVATSVVSAVFLLACAKTVVDSVPTTETNKTAPTPTGAKDAGTTPPKDAGSTKKPPVDQEEDPPPGGQCAAEQSFDTCLDCCSTEHPTGSDTFYGAYIQCLCTSVCTTECAASLCDTANPTAPDTACDACITANGNGCQADVSAACSAEPDCVAWDKCIGDSDCQNKP
jgi:hypothetical protein